MLQVPEQELRAQIDPASVHPVLLKARLPAAVAAQVADLGLDGVYLEQAPSREYPEGSIAAQVLGFVGRDFHGLAGLEASLDETLAGEQGEIESEWDTTGREISIARRKCRPALSAEPPIASERPPSKAMKYSWIAPASYRSSSASARRISASHRGRSARRAGSPATARSS